MQEEKEPKITFRAEELAVPEVHTGALPLEEELEEDDEEIRYDNVAIPEIHVHKKEPEE